MSILETEKIDLVATRPESPVVKLVISDHLEWDDLYNHSRLLQAKINAYLAFVESGQLSRTTHPPIPASPQIWISLVLQHLPSEAAREFLTQVEAFLRSVDIKFEYKMQGARADG